MEKYKFQLFIIPGTIDSNHAVKNIELFCEKHLKGMYEIEIIDIRAQPNWATKENIFAVPILIKKLPLPEDRLIGDLSDTKKILKMLRIDH